MTSLTTEAVPLLEDWMSLADAASLMRLSANGLRKRVFEYGEFDAADVRKVSLGQNPLFLLRKTAVMDAVKQENQDREDYQNTRLPVLVRSKAKRAQRARILAWARESGFAPQDSTDPKMGRLSNALLNAYVATTKDTLIE